MSARVRTVIVAIRDWIINPVTMTVCVLVAVAMGVWLVLDPPREVAGPPESVATAKVAGYCATVVSAGGTVWALAPGAVDGHLRRIDPADVDRESAECMR